MSENGQVPAKLRKIDPGKLKLRELAEIEKLIGRRIAGELQSGDLGMDVMQALLWMEQRRHDPTATYEQAGEVELETLMDLFADDDEGEGEPVDPTSRPPSTASGSSSNGEPTSKPTPASTTSGG